MNTVEVTVDAVEMNAEIDPAVFQPPASARPGPSYLKRPGLARLPFRYVEEHLWMRASVNGGPLADFIYDTGASATVLDSAYAASIGVASAGKLQGEGAGAAGTGSLATLKSLRVEAADGDGIEMHDLPIAVLDLNSMLEPFFWRPVAGIIGFDLISRFVNVIDYDSTTVTLRDPKTYTHEGGGQKLAMRLAGTVPVVTMTLDGRWTGEYRLDVGSSATVDLHGPFWRSHGIDRALHGSAEVMGGGFGGTFTSRVGRLQSLEIGPFGWKEPLVSLSGATTGALASEEYAGNIGNRLLERFQLTLDYERREVWLEPGRRYAQRDVLSMTGLQLVRQGDEVSIARVLAKSPAARAGLAAGDVVLSVDGRPPLELDLDGIERLTEEGKPGTRVVYEIRRGSSVMKKTLKLESVL
jgi:hypothetical protein